MEDKTLTITSSGQIGFSGAIVEAHENTLKLFDFIDLEDGGHNTSRSEVSVRVEPGA